MIRNWLVIVVLFAVASCGEQVNVHVACKTTAAPAVECSVEQTAGKSEVEACWDFFAECGNGVVVEAPHWCAKVEGGKTVKVTIPGNKLTNVDKCGGDPAKLKAKMTNMTINGKPSEN
jgi:hypothetical protein